MGTQGRMRAHQTGHAGQTSTVLVRRALGVAALVTGARAGKFVVDVAQGICAWGYPRQDAGTHRCVDAVARRRNGER